ncbi:ATP-binding protein [Shewanella sp. S1-49-MNA-CIBAN-0167]|uniref:ATP-binding protein n=2 Tax=unclassified Shewanella TaxID=196818 RepID=UPI00331878E4
MSLVNPKQYIISARSNGYKDTAYAIAELVDNSIQAGANKAEVLLFEGSNRNVQEIAIIDNGSGMSRELLASALGFGESGRDKDIDGNVLNEDASVMGKFGMGLPNASVSQCKRVEVWSWQVNAEVNYSYLDVQEIIDGTYRDLPEPQEKKISMKLLDAAFDGILPESGTIVLWSNLDKLKWKRSVTLFEKSEFQIGRMYRRFISDGKCTVQFKVCDLNGNKKNNALFSNNNSFIRQSNDGFIRANDPLYLTAETSLHELPGLHPDESPTLFEESENFTIEIEYNNKIHTVSIRSSIARQELIEKILSEDSRSAGHSKWGKHCEANLGLSVMRSGRELELITNQFFDKRKGAEKERWIGLEIDIPPSLDEVFGVTNNKQHAHNLKDYSNNDFYDGSGKKLENIPEILDYLKSTGEDDTAILVSISKKIITAIDNLRKKLNGLNVTKKNSKLIETTDDDKVGIVVNAGFAKRDEVNTGRTMSQDANYEEYEKALVDKYGYNIEEAKYEKDKLQALKSRISVKYSQTSDHSFFEVENLQGITVLVINTEHQVYKDFISNMEDKDKLLFKVMLGAWARLEDETLVDTRKRQLEKARADWSAIIEDMFDEL